MELNTRAVEILGVAGRMLSAYKTYYLSKNPQNKVIFNSNLFLEKDGLLTKIWFGDLDLATGDESKLQKLANELQGNLYILKERDGRFHNEDNPLLENAVKVFNPQNAKDN